MKKAKRQNEERRICFRCANFIKHSDRCIGCNREKPSDKGGREKFVLDDYWKNKST